MDEGMVSIGSASEPRAEGDCEPAVSPSSGIAAAYLENGYSVVGW